MADLPPTNRILRVIADRRNNARNDVLAGAPAGKPADEIGIAYTAAVSRYNILDELYDEVAELLKQGDDFE